MQRAIVKLTESRIRGSSSAVFKTPNRDGEYVLPDVLRKVPINFTVAPNAFDHSLKLHKISQMILFLGITFALEIERNPSVVSGPNGPLLNQEGFILILKAQQQVFKCILRKMTSATSQRLVENMRHNLIALCLLSI